MKFTPRCLTEPVEPVTLEEAKLHLRISSYSENSNDSSHPDDPLILGLIIAAREHAEAFTGLALARCTTLATGYSFPPGSDQLELPLSPATRIDQVQYLSAGSLLEYPIADLELVSATTSLLFLPEGVSWPVVASRPGAVRITYEAGFAPSHSSDTQGQPVLPQMIRQAMLLLVGHLYANREASVERALSLVPLGIESLLRPHRVRYGFA